MFVNPFLNQLSIEKKPFKYFFTIKIHENSKVGIIKVGITLVGNCLDENCMGGNCPSTNIFINVHLSLIWKDSVTQMHGLTEGWQMWHIWDDNILF